MRRVRKLVIALVLAGIALAIFTACCNLVVDSSARGSVYTSAQHVPRNDIGIVLGCPVMDRRGRISLYYAHRIEAAAELYHSGRVSSLIVSGHPGQPRRMKADLAALGVPIECISEDNDGRRTIASIISARDNFGLRAFTVITQPGHARRSIYLAKAYGLRAVAFAADDPRKPRYIIREYFAHVKAVLDVHILHRNMQLKGRYSPIKGEHSLRSPLPAGEGNGTTDR